MTVTVAIMASASEEPPDRGGLKMYKCHPNIPVKTVVCVYCEDTYHVSDFNNKFKLKNEQGPLVVCPDHNLTSKIGDHVLTEDVKMLIAQIKAAKEEQIKQQILKEVMENSKISNNDSEEYENLRMENYLLKYLNAELKDKNMILKELLKKEKEL